MPKALGLEYRFICPSYKRPENMKTFMKLFPEATIVIRPDEKEAYSKFVPEEQLTLINEPVTNYAETSQWIFNHFEEEVLIILDDDTKTMTAIVGRKCRRITDGNVIKSVLLSSARVCKDLGIRAFAYRRTMTALQYFNDTEPFALKGMMTNPHGFIGRPFKWDTRNIGRQDEDLSMQIMKDHRILFIDQRFFFDDGLVFGGKGGLQVQRNKNTIESDKKLLKEKWGDLIEFQAKKGTENVLLKVTRKAPKGLLDG